MKTLNRRAALRGMIGGSAVMIGLPALEIMLNSNGTAYADGGGLPLRFVAFYWADGVNIARYEPAQTGASWELSEEMQPLAPVKDYINLLTGYRNHCEHTMTHHEGMTVFNGYSYIQGGQGLVSNSGGPTLDQLIADKIGDATTIRAIHTQVSKRDSTDGDDGTTTIAMSHRGTPGNLIAQTPQVNPQLVFQTLFGAGPVETDDTRPVRKRVLDAVKEDAARLNGKLGKLDKQRLDAHLQAVSELEAKIVAQPPSCTPPSKPTQTNTDAGGKEPITPVNQAMADLIKYAFVCDLTRVATVLFKRFVSSTVFDEINANEVHHNASHAGSETYHDGVVFQMQRLADLLVTLKDTPDGAGNLLDSTIVYASTDCSQGFSHSIDRQPIILAGHGRNYLAHPGIHLQATPWNGNEQDPNGAGNTSDALLTCLRAWDEAAPSIGGGAPMSSNVISEVLA